MCYKSHTSKKQAAAEPASSPAPPGGDLVEKLKAQQATPAPGAEKPDAEMPLADGASAAAASPAPPEAPPPAAAPAAPVQENHGRCFACNKRVGLTGFKCRCEYTFCATHRHANKHECAFDWKGMGRETVAKANQKVVADKMEKVRGRRRPTRTFRSFVSRARVAALASEPSTRSADPTPSSPRTFFLFFADLIAIDFDGLASASDANERTSGTRGGGTGARSTRVSGAESCTHV